MLIVEIQRMFSFRDTSNYYADTHHNNNQRILLESIFSTL